MFRLVVVADLHITEDWTIGLGGGMHSLSALLVYLFFAVV